MGNAETFSDALRECMEQLDGVRTKAEIDSWIKAHYPNRWKLGTLNGHLYGCCVNNPKGIEHHPSFPRFLFTHGNSRYELYDPQKHGAYDESGLPAGEHPEPELADHVPRAGDQNGDGGTAFAYEAHLRDYLARDEHAWSDDEQERHLFRNGEDTRYLPLCDRKVRLRQAIPRGSERLLYCDHLESDGEGLFRLACEYDLEGIVAKHKNAPYLPDAVTTWFKIRNRGYSQWVGREELFEREREQSPDAVGSWDWCTMACAAISVS